MGNVFLKEALPKEPGLPKGFLRRRTLLGRKEGFPKEGICPE